MKISDLITDKEVVCDLKVASKKQLLQDLSAAASKVSGVDEATIFAILLERERLGTTGVGGGVAIPHGKLVISKPLGVFAKLGSPVNFDSVDEKPVDLVFLLLAPENAGADHLKALACVSRVLRDEDTCARIRSCKDSEAVYSVLVESDA